MQIVSYFYIVKMAHAPDDPTLNGNPNYFSVDNPELLEVLHKPARRSRTSPLPKRLKAEVITISSSSDNDDQDEIKVVAKRINYTSVREATVEEVIMIPSSEDEDTVEKDEVKIGAETRKEKPAPQSVTHVESSREERGKSETLQQTDNVAPPAEENRCEHSGKRQLLDVVVETNASSGRSGLLADTTDSAALRHALCAVIQRMHNYHESLDVCNLRTRTVRFDSRSDRRKTRRKSLPRHKSAVAMSRVDVEIIMGVVESSQDVTTLSHLLRSLEMLTTMVSTTMFPPSELLAKILHKLLLGGGGRGEYGAAMRKSVHQLFHRILFLHPPTSAQSRLVYLNAFTDGGTQDFWSVVVDLLAASGENENVVMDIVLTVLQRDLEFWWKHRSEKEDEKETLIFALFAHKDCEVEKRVEFLFKNTKLDSSALLQLTALIALLCSSVDKRRNATSLRKRDSLKAKLARALARGTRHNMDDGRQVLRVLYRLRPAWLSMMVASALLDLREPVGNLSEAMEKLKLDVEQIWNRECVLSSLMVDKMLATFHYNVIHRAVALKGSSKIPFKQIAKFPKITGKQQSSSSSSQDFVRLESNLTLEKKDVVSSLEAINKVHVSNGKEGNVSWKVKFY